MILKKKIKTVFAFIFGLIVLSSPAMVSQEHAVQTASARETMPMKSNISNRVSNVKSNGDITLEYYLLNIYTNDFDIASTNSIFDANCKLSIYYNYLTDTFNNGTISFSYFDETYPFGIEHSITINNDVFVNRDFSCRLLINSGELNFYVENDYDFLWIPVLDDLTEFADGYFQFFGSLSYSFVAAEIANIKSIYNSGDFSSGYDLGYQAGVDVGYHQGFDSGQSAVNQQYFQAGYTKGFDDATEMYADGSLSLNGILNAIITAPSKIIKDGLDFEILGFNIGSLMMSLVVIGLIVWAIGFFKKG